MVLCDFEIGQKLLLLAWHQWALFLQTSQKLLQLAGYVLQTSQGCFWLAWHQSQTSRKIINRAWPGIDLLCSIFSTLTEHNSIITINYKSIICQLQADFQSMAFILNPISCGDPICSKKDCSAFDFGVLLAIEICGRISENSK